MKFIAQTHCEKCNKPMAGIVNIDEKQFYKAGTEAIESILRHGVGRVGLSMQAVTDAARIDLVESAARALVMASIHHDCGAKS